jgi:hypothetical protein
MPASVTGPSPWRSARSIIAVTANRPLVVSLMSALLEGCPGSRVPGAAEYPIILSSIWIPTKTVN